MKTKKSLIGAALILLLAACRVPVTDPDEPLTAKLPAELPESGAESPIASTTEHTPESTTTTTTKTTTKSTTTKTTTKSTTTKITTTTEAAPEAPIPLPEDFRLSDYLPDFDEVDFSYCSYISDLSFAQADEAAIVKAIEAYKSSALYTEAVDYLKEIFFYENGELTFMEDSPESLPRSTDLMTYIDRSAAPEIALKPDVIKSYRALFDGENAESLVLLRTALPMSKRDWSGNYHYHIPVYVNADGEAYILYDACSQDYGEFRLVSYDDYRAPDHALFGFGHNQSGQRSALYSFADGKPKLELSGCPIIVHDGLLLGGFGWGFFSPYLFDRENGEFFAASAITPSEELARMLCSDPTVLSYVPDAWKIYQKGYLQIIGGKYITFNTGIPWQDDTFVYNQTVKRFERVDQPITVVFSITDVGLPEQITKSYHVDLASEPYSLTRC